MPPAVARVCCALALLSLAGCPESASRRDAAPHVEDEALADSPSPEDLPREASAPDGSGIGRACTAPDSAEEEQGDCAEGQVCLRPPRYAFPGGSCSQRCEGERCPRDAECVSLEGGSRCMLRCGRDADCRVADGYQCDYWSSYGYLCVPRFPPIGMRGVAACFYPDPQGTPPLARTAFAEDNLALSEGRRDLLLAAEGNVVARPGTNAVVASYIAFQKNTTFMGSSLTRSGASVERVGGVTEDLPHSSDPVLAYTRDGALHMAFLALRFDRGVPTGMRLRLARSEDDGATWTNTRTVVPDDYCAAGCDKPWLLAAPTPGGEALYLGFSVRQGEQFALVLARSEDGGATWSEPQPFAVSERVGAWRVEPNLISLAAAPDGALSVAYVGRQESASGITSYGTTANRVYLRRSPDGGRTWAEVRRVSAPTDAVVYIQPTVALDGATTYVVYVVGAPTGAWDVVLATSIDGGGTWRYRRVNDDPEPCATHTLPALVADPARHLAHVVWLENRFGDGAVAYAACPQDASAPCGRNQAVSDRSFTFTTSRNPTRWHGDYVGLAFAPPDTLWAAWSDTRTGRPQMYLARGRLP